MLKPNGGIGIMVYAKMGRHGVYNMQNMMKMLLQPSDPMPFNINLTKRILNNLPKSNPLRVDPWKWKKLMKTIWNTTGTNGLVDLFLPAQDVPMSVDDIYQLVADANMHLISFVHSSLYKLDSYIHDRRLQRFLHERLKTRQEEEMFVERFTGNHYQHFFYVRKKAKVWSWKNELDMIPIPLRFDSARLGKALRNSTFMPFKNNNLMLYFKLPQSIYNETDAIERVLKHIDGKLTIREIRRLSGLRFDDFEIVFDRMYNVLLDQGKLYLSRFPVEIEKLTKEEMELREVLYPNMPRNGYHCPVCYT